MASLYGKFLILIAALLPAYLIRFYVFGIPTTLLEALIWLVFILGLAQPSVRHSWVEAAKTLPKPMLIASLFYILASLFSVLISPHLETSLGILKGWIITPLVYGFMVFAASLKIENWNLKITRSLILSGLVMALIGLSQLGMHDRISGIYDVPNSLALFLAPIIILAIFSPFRSAAFIIFLALLLTQSVAGAVSVLVAASLFLVFGNWKLKFVWVLCTVFCVLFLAFKINYLLQPSSSAHVRLQLWSISWDLIKEHPLLGIGLGTFEPAYQEKLHERFTRPASAGQPAPLPEFVFRDPHNWLLSFWLNTGLLGLLSFAFLNGYILWQAFRHSDFGFRHSAALALLTLLLFGFVDTIYWKNDLATLHWILIGLSLKRQSDIPRKLRANRVEN